MPSRSFQLPENNLTAMLDKDTLKYPLEIRKWHKGDAFIPLGMRGKKKVSDFMIDEKIPLTLKKDLLVLTSSKNIVWIIGHRIDERYKVTARTETVLKIWFEKK
jgi:tRNA(Ile)-lysidine synthase